MNLWITGDRNLPQISLCWKVSKEIPVVPFFHPDSFFLHHLVLFSTLALLSIKLSSQHSKDSSHSCPRLPPLVGQTALREERRTLQQLQPVSPALGNQYDQEDERLWWAGLGHGLVLVMCPFLLGGGRSGYKPVTWGRGHSQGESKQLLQEGSRSG